MILTAAVAALAALLLAGCQRSDQKEPTQTLIQCGKEPADSLKKDSVEAFNEQMRRWHVLHGGMSRWESDKKEGFPVLSHLGSFCRSLFKFFYPLGG